MPEPAYKSVRECVSCGVLASANEKRCQVCFGVFFRDRYQCQSCGKLFDSAMCAECIKRNEESPPIVLPASPKHSSRPRLGDEFIFDDEKIDRRPSRAKRRALSRLAGPAISLMLLSCASLAYWCACAPLMLIGEANNQKVPQAQRTQQMVIQMGMITVAFLANGFVVIGSLQMKNAGNYGVALTAAIISVIPCCSPCYLLGIPFGIWALVVMMDEDVRHGFACLD